jgi:2-hydroxychromene-2-carboxylate isomerase
LKSVYSSSLLEVNLEQEWNNVTFRQKVAAFKALLSYMYSGHFARKMTLAECDIVQMMAMHLGLKNTAEEINLRAQYFKQKLISRVQRDLQIKQF